MEPTPDFPRPLSCSPESAAPESAEDHAQQALAGIERVAAFADSSPDVTTRVDAGQLRAYTAVLRSVVGELSRRADRAERELARLRARESRRGTVR